MSEMTFYINDQSTGGSTPVVEVTIRENADGTVTFIIRQIYTNGVASYLGDLRGFFFDLANSGIASKLAVTSNSINDGSSSVGIVSAYGTDTVKSAGTSSNNMNGLLGTDGGFDFGISIGTEGVGAKGDDVRSIEFTLNRSDNDGTSSTALSLADFAGVNFGVRITSIGVDTNGDGIIDTTRSGSVKMLEQGAATTSANLTVVIDDDSFGGATGGVGDDAVSATSGTLGSAGGTVTLTGMQCAAGLGFTASANLTGTLLTIYQDGVAVIEIEITNAATGAYEVRHLAPIQHPGPDVGGNDDNDFQIHIGYLVTSSDGDTADGLLTISIDDASVHILATSDTTGAVTENGMLTAAGSIDFTAADGATAAVDTAAAILVYNSDGDSEPSDLPSGLGASAAELRAAFEITDPATGAWSFDASTLDLEGLGSGDTITLTYTVSVTDDDGDTDSVPVVITITGINDAPVAAADANCLDLVKEAGVQPGGNTAEPGDSSAAGNVLANDTDVDAGDTLAVAAVAGEAGKVGATVAGTYGSVTIGSDGEWSYTLDNTDPQTQALYQGQVVTETFSYTVTDEDGATSTASLVITITGTNDAPVVNDVAVTNAVEDGPTVVGSFSGDDVDSDDDGSTLTYAITSSPSEGSVVNNHDGTFTFDPGSDFQDLAEGETRQVTFTYTATDAHGAVSNSGIVMVTITGTNDAPEIAIATASAGVTEDVGPVSGSLRAVGSIAFTDVDLADAHTVSVTPAAGGYFGTLHALVSEASTGDGAGQVNWRFNVDNAAVQYLADGEELTQSYTITVDDGEGGTASQVLTVTVTGTNDDPQIAVATGDSDAETLAESNSSLSVSGTLTVTDVDFTDTVDSIVSGVVLGGDYGPLTSSDIEGMLTLTGGASWLDADSGDSGNLEWTFDSGTEAFDFLAEGDELTLTYTIESTDSFGATTTHDVTITITGTNDAPTVSATNSVTTLEDNASAATAIAASDPDQGAVLTYSVKTGEEPAKGSVTFDDAAGTFVYTPNANAHGSDSFTIVVTDEHGATAEQVVSVTITPVNDAPAGADKTVTVSEDGSYALTAADFGFADPDDIPADALAAVRITTLPAAGTLTLSGSPVTAGQFIPVADITAGNLVFTPAANANGAGYAISTFQVQDDGGTANGGIDLDPNANTITVDVTAVNDAPVATGGATLAAIVEDATMPAGASVSSLFGGNFSDATDEVSGGSSADSFAGIAISSHTADASKGAWQYSADGGTTWTALGNATATAAVTLDASALLRFVPAADYDGPATALSANLIESGLAITNGAAIDLTGATGGTSHISAGTVLLSHTISEVNDAPVAGDDGLSSVAEDSGTRIISFASLLDNDSAGPASEGGQSLTITVVSNVVGGTAVIVGTNIHFTPDPDFNGTASFDYTVQDNGTTAGAAAPLTDTGRVSFSVTAVNDAPVNSVPGAQTVNEDTALAFNAANGNTISINDVDVGETAAPDNTAEVKLSVGNGTLMLGSTTGLTVSGNGTATVTVTGTIAAINAALATLTYQGNLNFNGSDELKIETSDLGHTGSGGAQTDTDTVAITVTAVNDAPIAAADSYSVNEDGSLVIAAPGVLANDSDVDGDALTAVLVNGPAHGTLTLNADGSFTYTPDGNYNGADSFTYKANDGTADSGVVTVDLTVNSVNDAPAGTDNTITMAEDGTYALAASDFGFSDPNDSPADALAAVKISSLPAAGTLYYNGAAITAMQVSTGFFVSAADLAAGKLTYAPAANANGTGYASFTFQVQDSGGGSNLDLSPNTITFNVTAVNDAPAISSNGGGDTASVNAAENTTAVTTVTSTDVDGPPPTYSIVGGADAAKFGINTTTGQLYFLTPPDYEAPTDADGNNNYIVEIAASDGSLSDTQTITVNVTNVNAAPSITSNGGDAIANVNIVENSTAVTTVIASDDGENSGTITYSIVGGADSAKFTIDSSTGALSFVSAPNFEAPTDVGANNVYDVVVRASDGTLFDDQAIAVTVTDVAEAARSATTDVQLLVTSPLTDQESMNFGIIAALSATDSDTGTFTYTFGGGTTTYTEGGATFTISGSTLTSSNLSEQQVYSLTITAAQAGDEPSLNKTETFTIKTGSNAGGQQGIDPLTGLAFGDDILFAGKSGDTLFGLSGNDQLFGHDGDDTIDGGTGDDLLYGGGGNDTFIFAMNDGTDVISDSEGTETISITSAGASLSNLNFERVGNDLQISVGSTQITINGHYSGAAVESIVFSGGASIYGYALGTASYALSTDSSSPLDGTNNRDVIASSSSGLETLNGGGGNDLLFGNGDNDTINGGAGNDLLVGGSGTDRLTGGTGNDTLVGGAGDDRFVLDSALAANLDTIVDYAQADGDTIDITGLLSVSSGTNVIAGGYLRVTTTGLVQVDANGGANSWVTVGNVNIIPAGDQYALTYLSGGVATTVNVSPSGPPVALDLNGDGVVSFLATDAGATFDYGGGRVQTAWVGPEDGLLARDANRDGDITHDEIVFATSGSDLEGLRVYDSNGDGVLSSADEAFAEFRVWQDADSDGAVDSGELQSLTALGIASISLTSDGVPYSAAGGDVQVVGTGSFTRSDGSTGVLADAVFSTGLAAALEEQRALTSPLNSAALMGVLAAVGLSAEFPALARVPDNASEDLANATAAIRAIAGEAGARASVETARPALSGETREAVDELPVQAGTAEVTVPLHADEAVADATASAPTELLKGTDAPIQGEAKMDTLAEAIAMPTAEMLHSVAGKALADASNADGSLDFAKATAEVSRVLADALTGGDAEHSLDDLLDAAGVDSRAIDVAEVGAGYFVGFDWGVAGLHSASSLMMAPLAIAMHQDALPTA